MEESQALADMDREYGKGPCCRGQEPLDERILFFLFCSEILAGSMEISFLGRTAAFDPPFLATEFLQAHRPVNGSGEGIGWGGPQSNELTNPEHFRYTLKKSDFTLFHPSPLEQENPR
jgi:hypothetical protein